MRISAMWAVFIILMFVIVIVANENDIGAKKTRVQLQPDIICLDGIEYYSYRRGSAGFMAARFTADSKVVTCESD